MTGAELLLLLLQGCFHGQGKFSFSFTHDGKKSRNESVTPPQVDTAGNKTFFFLFFIIRQTVSPGAQQVCRLRQLLKGNN